MISLTFLFFYFRWFNFVYANNNYLPFQRKFTYSKVLIIYSKYTSRRFVSLENAAAAMSSAVPFTLLLSPYPPPFFHSVLSPSPPSPLAVFLSLSDPHSLSLARSLSSTVRNESIKLLYCTFTILCASAQTSPGLEKEEEVRGGTNACISHVSRRSTRSVVFDERNQSNVQRPGCDENNIILLFPYGRTSQKSKYRRLNTCYAIH